MELDEIRPEAEDMAVSVGAEWNNAPTSPTSHLEEPSLPSHASLEETVLGEESGKKKEMEVETEEGLHVAKPLRCNL